MKQASAFFQYARERYGILLDRRGGRPKPWTKDPVLLQYRFCNVFREDDTTTIWIRENLREPMTDNPHVLMAMCVARFFNRISTLEAIKEVILEYGWNERMALSRIAKIDGPIVTGAYMLKTPAGLSKAKGIAQILHPICKIASAMGTAMEHKENSMQELHTWLCQFPYMGKFMAYEVVTDMRFTKIMGEPSDKDSWASAGPGAARGLSRVIFGMPDCLKYQSERDQDMLMEGMQKLLSMSRNPVNWPAAWPQWEMREVEHTLCEFDKYERARLGEGRPKQLYDGQGTD